MDIMYRSLRYMFLLILPVLSLYSAGLAIIFSCGLAVDYLHWYTFIVFWLEFHGNSSYDLLMYKGFGGLILPFIFAGWMLSFT